MEVAVKQSRKSGSKNRSTGGSTRKSGRAKPASGAASPSPGKGRKAAKKARGVTWAVVPDPAKPSGAGVRVPLPSRATCEEDVAEAAHQVRVMQENKQIARSGKALPAGATHVVVRDDGGREYLVRKRFSAL